jgi:hypothetical protein
MSRWEMKIITAEAQRLLALAAEDADLRADLRALAEEILATTEGSQPDDATSMPSHAGATSERSPKATGPPPVADAGVPHGPTTQEAAQVDRPRGSGPLRELTLGRSRPSPVEIHHLQGAIAGAVASDADLPEIEARCRLKAEGARRAAAHQRPNCEWADLHDDFASQGPEITAWADRLTDCFYWMNSSESSQPANIGSLDNVGGCFEAVAEALSLVRAISDDHQGNQNFLERVLPLVAEAQSALRASIQAVHGDDDPDQLEVFEWLKMTAARHHVYIKRYMRADDQADAARWTNLIDRIERVEVGHRKRLKDQGPFFDHLRSQLKVIQEDKGTEQDWRKVIETVEGMVSEGIPPSNREIRELLLSVIDELPDRDDLPSGFRLVLREIDRFLATRTLPSGKEVTHEPTVDVKEARRLLAGRSAMLIGGICRRDSQKMLKAALGLKELSWIETREHQSVGSFEPAVARPDVALVLLAIRWSSHAFGDVKQLCERYGKPLVRLPGGYSPNQVAAQILAQCSGQLSAG